MITRASLLLAMPAGCGTNQFEAELALERVSVPLALADGYGLVAAEGLSHNAALWAMRLGFTNDVRFPGGIHAWKGAGYELEEE